MNKTRIKRYFAHKSNGKYCWEYHVLIAATVMTLVAGVVLMVTDDCMWIEAFQLALLMGIGADLADWRYKDGLKERNKNSHQSGD